MRRDAQFDDDFLTVAYKKVFNSFL